jgi:predicted O-methyltransferase YrrM
MSSQIISLTLKNLKKIWLEREIPNITEQNAEYLKKLIAEKNPKHLLEIGTANGYSTLHFASILDTTSSITTIEQAWNMHNDAVINFKNCKLKNIISIWGDAKLVIPTLCDGYYDFVYIDAMKKEYLQYLILVLSKMTPDAMIVIDDVIKFRDKMEDLYDFLDRNHIEYNICSTDPDDGIMIINASSLWNQQFSQQH